MLQKIDDTALIAAFIAVLDRLGFASIDELAFDAARRKGISTPSEQAAA